MDNNEISFENLPKAVAHLVNEVAEIKALVEKGQDAVLSPKGIPIGIDGRVKSSGKPSLQFIRLCVSVYSLATRTESNSTSSRMSCSNG